MNLVVDNYVLIFGMIVLLFIGYRGFPLRLKAKDGPRELFIETKERSLDK